MSESNLDRKQAAEWNEMDIKSDLNDHISQAMLTEALKGFNLESLVTTASDASLNSGRLLCDC